MSDDLRDFLANARARGGLAATAGARVLSLDELRPRQPVEEVAEPWGLAALRGRLVELSASGATATLTAAVGLVLEAQQADEPVAWIVLPQHGCFYPPDLVESGVDLGALVIVRITDASTGARAAERLLRSNGFGLIVLDLATDDLSMARQGRLTSLAQAHDAAVVCLTQKESDVDSLGSLVSLRVEALRMRDESFSLGLRALKDKRRGPGWTRATKVRGPVGM